MRIQRVTRDDTGAVAVLVALMAVFLTGMLAFAADLGNAYSLKRRLSTAADGAALAAAQELATDNSGCGPAVSDADRAAARTVADDYSSTRNASGSALRAGTDGFSLSCVASGKDGLVTVRNEQTVDFVFGNVFGVASAQPNGQATARYGLAKTVTGLRPFGLCTKDASVAVLLQSGLDYPVDDAASFALRPTVRITIDKTVAGSCGAAPGNWGVMDFDGGSNPEGDTRTWVEDGYGQELDLIGDTISGDTGAPSGGPGALGSAMNATVGKTITVPLFDSVTGTGSSASFHITGFVSAQLCGWKFGSWSTLSSCSLSLPVGQPNDPDFLELRFKQSFTVGDFANCGVTCPTYGIRTIALDQTP